MLPPSVGILVNDRLYRSIPLGDTRYEEIEYYVEAGNKLGFTPCFFRIQDMKAGRSCMKALVKHNDTYVLQTVEVPKVIHNRAIYSTIDKYRKLRQWAGKGHQLFNCWNRYGKLRIHKLLMEDPGLRCHLPETIRATTATVAAMMKKYEALIIKPDRSSVGRGLMKLWRTEKGWCLSYPASLSIHNKIWRTLSFRGSRLPVLLRNRLSKTKYIVQQCLPLATWEGRPFDLRVSVQRGGNGEWQVTGIVGKVASDKAFITNVAQGGTVQRLECLAEQVYPDILYEELHRTISDFSLQIARHLGRRLPHLADLGLDVGLTKEAMPLFIECNGKDQRYSFKEAGMLKQWKATYKNPMAYASFLLKKTARETKEG